MKRLVLAVVCILLFILDNTIMPFFSINTYYPSILFTFAAIYSIINGKKEAVFIGVFSGVLQDIYFFNGFGINSLANMVACVVAATIGESLFKEKSAIPIVSTLFIGMLKSSLVYIVLYAIGQKSDYKAIIFTGVYGTLLAVFMYKKIYRFSQKPFMKREWRF
jgi:rod shape-determining protein MreD